MMEIVIPYIFVDLIPLFVGWAIICFTLYFGWVGKPIFDPLVFSAAFMVGGFTMLCFSLFVSLFVPTLFGIQVFNFSIGGAP
jgi:hypothetical protein